METKESAASSREASLTESWNVVEAQDVNNISEGSDGESIEVLDEETHHPDSTSSEGSEQRNENLDSSETFEPQKCHPFVEMLIFKIRETCQNGHFPTELFANWARCALHIYGIVAIIILAIISAAICAYYVVSMDQVIFGMGHFFNPHQSLHRDGDYQNLVKQLEAYKEESEGLKGIVSDLNAAVTNLRKELNHQKAERNSFKFDARLTEEEQLFQQLLNIHTGAFLNESKQESDLPRGKTFEMIEDLLESFENDEEREENFEIISFFSKLPKHLLVLSNFDSVKQNTEEFVTIWRDKLTKVNEKLNEDIKSMQLKMIKHIVKHLKSTQKCFFINLCSLKNIKKDDCYKIFLNNHSFDKFNNDLCFMEKDNPDEFDGTCGGVSSCEMKSRTDTIKRKPINGKERVQQSGGDSDKSEYFTENKYTKKANEKKVELKAKPATNKDANLRKNQVYNLKKSKPSLHNPPRKPRDLHVQKGMESDLLEQQHMDTFNSFSSFSEGRFREEGEKGFEGQSNERDTEDTVIRPEGFWFLRLGSHRSRLRFLERRGDWLFDRARYRRRRNTIYGQPWYSRMPRYLNKYF